MVNCFCFPFWLLSDWSGPSTRVVWLSWCANDSLLHWQLGQCAELSGKTWWYSHCNISQSRFVHLSICHSIFLPVSLIKWNMSGPGPSGLNALRATTVLKVRKGLHKPRKTTSGYCTGYILTHTFLITASNNNDAICMYFVNQRGILGCQSPSLYMCLLGAEAK